MIFILKLVKDILIQMTKVIILLQYNMYTKISENVITSFSQKEKKIHQYNISTIYIYIYKTAGISFVQLLQTYIKSCSACKI